jgi:hypothetical protein
VYVHEISDDDSAKKSAVLVEGEGEVPATTSAGDRPQVMLVEDCGVPPPTALRPETAVAIRKSGVTINMNKFGEDYGWTHNLAPSP